MPRPWTSAILLLALFTVLSGTARAEPTTEERNKAIATRVFEENFNEGRFAVAYEIYAPDFENHGLHRDYGLAEDQDAVHAEKQAFPDLRMTVDMLVAEGDLVTAVWTFRGTHTRGGYGGLPPTGARIEMRGITVWRIVGGRIRDEWTAFNDLGAYVQAAARVKGYLFAAAIALVALIVALERALVWMARRAYRALRRVTDGRA
jgi:predicted ester cyclase